MTTLLIASRYLMGRKLRTFLTTLAVVFGVFVIFGMNIIVPTLLQAFTANAMAAAGQVDITVSEKHGETFSLKLLDKVSRTDGVKVAEGYIQRTMNLPENYFDRDATTADQFSGLTLTGIDPGSNELHTYNVQEGRFLRRSDTASAVITATLAEGAGVTVGDKLEIPTPRGQTKLTIVGLLPATALPGNEPVLVTLSEAQYLLGEADKISAIDANFTTTDEAERKATTETLKAALGDNYQIGAVTAGSAILSSVQIAQFAFNFFGFMALLMGGFIIFNTFRTVVAERRHDIGTLRSLGASRGQIIMLILSEGLLQGIIGTAIGLVMGYLLAFASISAMRPLMEQYIHIRLPALVIPLGLVIVSAVIGIGVTLAAGLLPAFEAARVTPMAALRPSTAEVQTGSTLTTSVSIGLTLIGLSLVALLVGTLSYAAVGIMLFFVGVVMAAPALLIPIARIFNMVVMVALARQGTGTIAEANLSRQPSRGAVTASATMIGLAVIVAVGGMTTSVKVGFLEVIRKSLGSDYLLVPPSIGVWETNVGARSQLASQLRAIPGVDAVSTLRPALTEVEDVPSSVLGIDPVEYPKVAQLNFTEGSAENAYYQLAQGRTVIVNGVLANRVQVAVGDDMRVSTPAGLRTYRVVGIAGDYFNAKLPTLYISQTNLKKDFGKDEDVFLQINLTKNASPADVQPRIEGVMAKYPQFRLISGRDYFEQNREIFDTAFLAYDVMLAILAIPSLIAMVNTLAIAVIERTREIGMLRATGATRGQVTQMILGEAILLAGVGTLFGVLSGLYLGYVLVTAMAVYGYPIAYFFPTSGIVVAILVGLGFGGIAAILPSRQAAQLEIVRALQYE